MPSIKDIKVGQIFDGDNRGLFFIIKSIYKPGSLYNKRIDKFNNQVIVSIMTALTESTYLWGYLSNDASLINAEIIQPNKYTKFMRLMLRIEKKSTNMWFATNDGPYVVINPAEKQYIFH